MGDFEVGFLMGIVAGEGSFTGDRYKPAFRVKMHVRDQPLLERLCGQVGGRINGPYTHGGRRYVMWTVRGVHLPTLVQLVDTWLPPCYKRQQFVAWREKWSL